MTDLNQPIDALDLAYVLALAAGATSYAPLPIDPFDGRMTLLASERPQPRPQPAPSGPSPAPSSPSAPAYPSLPTEPDTKDGDGAEQR
jgi:hypothetical protein